MKQFKPYRRSQNSLLFFLLCSLFYLFIHLFGKKNFVVKIVSRTSILSMCVYLVKQKEYQLEYMVLIQL